jgi:hypothetical protein
MYLLGYSPVALAAHNPARGIAEQDPQMIDVHFSVSREPDGWVVKHNGGVLGYARSRSEAVTIAKDLLSWINEQGRAGDLQVDEARPAPPRAPTGFR